MKSYFNNYFASSNGYGGFRCNFDKVFNPLVFEKIFILKGGPGTGKSTLMKRISSYFEEELPVDKIYCSSDKNSLDGIIIYKNEKRFAVIDGTAPHILDPKFPGVVEEIINLGEFWYEEHLSCRKDEIISLSKLKKKHYENGYNFLKSAGECHNYINKFISPKSTLNPKIDDLSLGRHFKRITISSFSKDGYYRLQVGKISKKTVSVVGNFDASEEFLKSKITELRDNDLTLIISPFSEEIIEGVYDDTTGTMYMKDFDGADEILNIDCYFNFIEQDILRYYDRARTQFLEMGKTEFLKASEAHFALESIYTPAMQFDKTESITEKIISKIESA